MHCGLGPDIPDTAIAADRAGRHISAMPPLLHLQDITLALGTGRLLDGAELAVGAGDRIGLVGRNGSGKSTLLRIAAGRLAPDGGRRFLQPGATLRYLPQEPDLSGHATTLDFVLAGLGPGDDPHRARLLLEQLGLTGTEAPARLSGGQARRAAIAQALAAAPDLLLLDEPTNHLDLPAIEWLQSELEGVQAGLVLVSHDRRLLSDLTRSTVWLADGRTHRLSQGFAAFEQWRDERLAQQEAEVHKLGRQIAREEDWLRYGVTARRRRNQRRLAELQALRQRRREQRRSEPGLRLAATGADVSGRQVIVADRVSKAFGARAIVRDLSTRVLRGDRIGIVGPNGAGKTTLLRLLTGAMAPDAGTVTLGSQLSVVTLDQMRAVLDPERTLADTLSGGTETMLVGGERRHVIGAMRDFLFRPEQARTPVGQLSGGERGRLMLAVALAQPANLLVLDEPTNDLDLETLDLLQEMLADYPGTVLLVSHDRDFLDRVVTATLAAEGDGRWVEYAGGYSDMLHQRGDAAPAAPPRRPQPRPEPRAAPSQTPPAEGVPRRGKLSFREQHALQTEIATLEARLSDPDLYARDPACYAASGVRLAAAREELGAAEERWLELEIAREALDG